MPQFFEIHTSNPQRRLLSQAAAILRAGGLIVYPTDSCYALGCCLGEKAATERVRRVRGLRDDHRFTLLCRDLSELAAYGKVDDQTYRVLRALTPGPFTFVLPSTRDVPRRLQHPRRKTIGLRVPEHPVTSALLESLGEPIMSSSLHLPGDDFPLTEAEDARAALASNVDLILDGGRCGIEPTTVIDMTGELPHIARQGRGDTRGLV